MGWLSQPLDLFAQNDREFNSSLPSLFMRDPSAASAILRDSHPALTANAEAPTIMRRPCWKENQ